MRVFHAEAKVHCMGNSKYRKQTDVHYYIAIRNALSTTNESKSWVSRRYLVIHHRPLEQVVGGHEKLQYRDLLSCLYAGVFGCFLMWNCRCYEAHFLKRSLRRGGLARYNRTCERPSDIAQYSFLTRQVGSCTARVYCVF